MARTSCIGKAEGTLLTKTYGTGSRDVVNPSTPRMPKNKEKSKERVEDEQEMKEYFVEVILAARLAEVDKKGEGCWDYFVKWAGYDSDSNSWEPPGGLENCQRLRDSFWKHIGAYDKKCPVGTVLEAKETWIKKEKRLFAREIGPEQRNLRLKREEKERIRESKGRSTKSMSLDSQAQAQVRAKRKITSKKSAVDSDTESSGSEDGLYPKCISIKRKRGDTVPPPERSPPTDIHPPPNKVQKLEDGTKVATSAASVPAIKSKRNTVTPLFSLDSDEPDKTPSESESPDVPLSASSFEAKKGSTINRQSQIDSSKLQESFTLRTASEYVPQVSKSTTTTQKSKPCLPRRRQPAGVAAAHDTPSTPTIPQRTQLPKRSLLTGRVAGGGVSTSVNLSPQIANSKDPVGIPTKSRIHQDALHLVKPNAPRQFQMPLRQRLGPSTTSAIKTSFKKRLDLPAIIPTPEFQRTPTLPATASAGEPALSPHIIVESPLHLENLMLRPVDDNDNFMTLDDSDARTRATPVVSQSPSARAVEAFLKAIMPPELSAPLEPAIPERAILPPGALMSRKYSLPTKAVREWTWTGQVFTEANRSKAMFTARFDNVTEPQRYGMRFSVALAERNQITFPSFHDNKDLHAILRACKKPQQFAGLHPGGEEDQAPMITFAGYMAKHGKFVLVPTSLDGHVVANMLVVPFTEPICRRVLDIPLSISRAHPPLVVALLPWVASTKHLSHRWRHEPNNLLPSNISIDTQGIYGTQWDELLRRYPNLHRAFRILKPSNSFLEYLVGQSPRKYYIWHDKAEGSLTFTGLEARLLRTILEHCSSEQVSSARAARMIFIHVGALSRLHQFPGFIDICATKPSIQFHTYGTHSTIPPERWGFREIYPLGGVITFTPMAILYDYLDVMNRISQIDSHPLWVCYVLPSVLGFVAKHHVEDPLMQFDLRKTPILLLLTAISKGQVALLNSPLVKHSPTNGVETNSDWVITHWIERPETPRDILDFCVTVFNQKYGQMDKLRAALAILEEISSDLSCIRQQPVIMDKHRRYIILKAKTECRLIDSRDGNEWTTAMDFDFRDNFFPKQ